MRARVDAPDTRSQSGQVDDACPEHAWELVGLRQGADGLLSEAYQCARCPATRLVGPDELGPHSPDLPG